LGKHEGTTDRATSIQTKVNINSNTFPLVLLFSNTTRCLKIKWKVEAWEGVGRIKSKIFD
jgi:hypothetical protein